MKIPLGKPIFDKEMEDAALDAFRNERFVLGESVHKFEEEFAKYCGTDYAISTSSGTNALQLSLTALGLKPGQGVITSPASFVATANSIIHAHGVPFFSDVTLETYNLDPIQLTNAATSGVKAIIPVHLYGYPAEMDAINDFAEKRGLIVIEDACQAHGASYHGKKTGNLGSVGCFSFYPSKNMTVGGDGGMITTNDKNVAAELAKLRDCGRKSQYIHDIVGYTSRLNSANAAIGRVQLRRLETWNKMRRETAELYDKLLGDIDSLAIPPKGSATVQPVYHLYVLRTIRRDELKAWLESRGISCGVHYALPIHLQPIYKELYGFKEGSYKFAEELCQTCLSIPIYPSISIEEITYISEKIHQFFEGRCGE